MAFDLEIYFEFLCAFVPPKPFVGPGDRPTECWCVLPNLRNEQNENWQHFPVFLFNEDNVQPLPAGLMPRQPDHVHEPPEGLALKHFDLQGEWVEIEPFRNGAPVSGGNFQPQSVLEAAEKPSSSQNLAESDLYYLFRLHQAKLDGYEVFEKNWIQKPAADTIAGVVHIKEGVFYSSAVTAEKFGVYNESSTNALHKQRIARRIVLKLDEIDAVHFHFTKFGGEKKTLRLGGTNTVTVRIRNCEDGQVFELGPPDYNVTSSSEINLYFRLAKGYDPGNPPPKLILKHSGDGPAGVCAPKVFDKLE